MESTLKINTLETQMKEVNKKLDDQDKKLDSHDRKMDAICEKIEDGFKSMSEKMEKTYVRKTEYELDKQRMREDIKKTADIWNWIIRIVMGLIIAALIGTILI
jgi:tetrahydromethanopterin S-methyltransferase subunit B